MVAEDTDKLSDNRANLGKSRKNPQIKDRVIEVEKPGDNNYYPLSMGNWLTTFMISDIPIVGLVCLLIWSFSKSTPLNKKDYCRSRIVYKLIFVVIYLVLAYAAIQIVTPYIDALLAKMQTL